MPLPGGTENPIRAGHNTTWRFIMNDNAFSVGACPAEYRDKLFLTPADIMDILGISENSCYRYLQSDLPFTKVKVGKLIRVNARSFWNWYTAS